MLSETHTPPSPLCAPSWLFGQEQVLFASDESTGSPTKVREPDRVLIIEDDLLIASQIETALTDAGFDVIGIAATGEEAIEMAGKERPVLAIADIRLAGDRDGVDTALELFRLHGVRCIFASAYSDHEARLRAEPAAPLGWLQKPYSMASLTQVVRRAAKELHGKR
jgi:two-component system, response regulator PdtaR